MSRTSTVHRSVRSALVCAGAGVAVVLSAGAAAADGSSPSPVPSATRSAAPSAVPTLPPVGPDGTRQGSALPVGPDGRRVGTTPRGGAQTGEADAGTSPTAVVLGSVVALAGAAGIGTAVVRRRRAGAQA
ncbi:Tat pathway signal sequence domain protein [Kitasatospora sp. DSM 101779]|uniref:Tat pathway signal sequence domain protein n=1 Tax=Kitasatospora sp. DSM 101779 TaxID=2853165 RepID=UPI0021DAC793|nr:Tat pathway signal sequence domain protein [Kitasatospora sp. DSM 101779]MCU7820508.1 Tat pathway signal sequence domain protein [Kitasatospora sp. DSM 101779]